MDNVPSATRLLPIKLYASMPPPLPALIRATEYRLPATAIGSDFTYGPGKTSIPHISRKRSLPLPGCIDWLGSPTAREFPFHATETRRCRRVAVVHCTVFARLTYPNGGPMIWCRGHAGHSAHA